jgi:hypothetical protein
LSLPYRVATDTSDTIGTVFSHVPSGETLHDETSPASVTPGQGEELLEMLEEATSDEIMTAVFAEPVGATVTRVAEFGFGDEGPGGAAGGILAMLFAVALAGRIPDNERRHCVLES